MDLIILISGIFFFFSRNSLIISILLVIFRLLMRIWVWLKLNTSWYGYLFIIITVNRVILIFLYMSCLNIRGVQRSSFSTFFIYIFLGLFFSLLPVIRNVGYLNINFFSSEIYVFSGRLYSSNMIFITFFILIYLLIGLIVILSIGINTNSPLRIKIFSSFWLLSIIVYIYFENMRNLR